MGRCPSCGRAVTPQARFCSDCGAPLAAEAVTAAPVPGVGSAELRPLTVAFCDLVGSTELSSRFDPEEYGELIRAYQACSVAVAHDYGGEVESYLGDGILFRFGWPEAHDDDPERAVRAGLEIVDRVEELSDELADDRRLSVRVGLHTGPVLIGELGASHRPETMALGQTLNLAARLQGIAEPGAVVISDATLELVRGIFVTEDLGSHDLRGIATPVRAHRAVQPSGVRSRLEAARGRLTPFVGRDAELDALVERWRAAAEGRGAAVLISGEAGVGKSRLVYELRERLPLPHSWLECRCSSYTQRTAFWPAIELVEEGLGLHAGEPVGERLAKLERGLAAVGEAATDAPPLIAGLLGLPADEDALGSMSSERRRRRTIEVLADWVIGLARLQPLVLLTEDLHWSDQASLELFAELAARAAEAPLLLVGTTRPEFEPPWEEGPSELRVEPLPHGESRQIVLAIGGGRPLPDDVLERIAAESGGIPLFTEEIGRMVLESGALVERAGRLELAAPLTEIEIPSTLQGSLMARLDRLGETRHIAQVAAAIGRDFDESLLREVAGLGEALVRDGLARLLADELVFRHGRPPNVRYTFKHALIQDAAYQSLLKRTRRGLHERIAAALERRAEEGEETRPEVLARHHELAGQDGAAAANYRRAAELAAQSSGHREAVAHLRKAIELLGRLPADRERHQREIEMQVSLGSSIIAARSYADPDIQRAYERARELCELLGDDAQVAGALAGLSIHYLNRGRMDMGAELARRVLEIGEREDDDALRLLGHVQLALPAICQARFAEALEHADRAARIYDPDSHRRIAYRFGTDHGVVAECFAGHALLGLGRLDTALERMRRGVDLARRVAHPFSLAYALLFETTIHWSLGDLDAQRRTAEAVLAIAEEQGFDLWIGLGRVYRGAERAVRRRDPDAIPEILDGSLVAGTTGNLAECTPVFACVAEARHAVGDIAGARETVEGALAVALETRQPWWDADLHRLKGELALDAPGGAGAERHFARAIAIAREQGFDLHELLAATGLARLLVARGERAAAIEAVAPVYGRFSEGLASSPLAQARALLTDLDALPAGPSIPAAGQAGSKPSVG